ncbi:MAG: DUF397 domain-containing protein [Streptosporangiaceae bacterium]|nr:DUF397 domain-containing protein [Streptosporangiaceae bacterium]
MAVNWRKSSHSGGANSNCVEVADHDGMILVRDSKERGRGPVHRYPAGEWRAFLASVRDGELDLDESVR